MDEKDKKTSLQKLKLKNIRQVVTPNQGSGSLSSIRNLQKIIDSSNGSIFLKQHKRSLHVKTPSTYQHDSIQPLIQQKKQQNQLLISLNTSLKEPLQNISVKSSEISQNLVNLLSSSDNQYKIRNQSIQIQAKNYKNWKIWLGKLFDQICQRGYQLFSHQQLNYNQMRVFCCEKILLNFIHFAKNNIKLDQVNCKEWENQMKQIIIHQCNKYPQTESSEVNKKIQQIVFKNQINNFENDDYDMIDKCKIQFKFNRNQDYTQQIMKFLNQIISLPLKETQKGQTLYGNFQTFMSNIFCLSEYRDKQVDMQLIFQQDLNEYQKCSTRFSSQDDIQYQQKVQSYTHYDIGCKISVNTQLFSPQQILSGKINIKSKSVARVIDKWVDQLRDTIQNNHSFIVGRTHRFKAGKVGQRVKLNLHHKIVLEEALNTQKHKVKQFEKQISRNSDQVGVQIIKDLGSLSFLTYMHQDERDMGQFNCKIQMASVQYSIQTLNSYVSSLLKAGQKFKQKLRKNNSDNYLDDQIQVNLVTCKIGDLFRCKFESREEEVVRIFEFLITLSQLNYKNMFKIIRVKNRLHLGTRDILINAWFKNSVVCQIQLAINANTHHKHKYMDKFNHFLYELKRSQLGVLIQMCAIWVNNCPKSQTFKKAIQKQNQIKRLSRFGKCKTLFNFDEQKYQSIKFPFICGLCKIFYSGQNGIFTNVLLKSYRGQQQFPFCGECISTRVKKEQRIIYFFDYLTQKTKQQAGYRGISFSTVILQLFDIQEILKYDIFIVAPINSRKFIKIILQKIETNSIIFLVENDFKNGKLDVRVKYQFNRQNLKQDAKKFWQKYCLFTFKNNQQIYVEFRPVKIQSQNYNEGVMKDLPYIKQYQKLKPLECIQIYFKQRCALLPSYKDPTVCLLTKLKTSLNMSTLIGDIKKSKQVIQLTNKRIKDQFVKIPQGIRIKMNTLLKELYLDQNMLQQIDFISHIQGLQAFSARKNSIKRIPQLPASLQLVDLSQNLITQIAGLNKTQLQLKKLNLSNNQINKINNLNNAINLTELVIKDNKIQVIEGLTTLTKLVKFVASQNPILKIQNLFNLLNLQVLSLGTSKIDDVNNLRQHQKLKTLNIQNSNISQICDTKLPVELKNINLSKNKLQCLQKLTGMKSLEQVILFGNKLRKISPLNTLQKVRILNLSHNYIQQIPSMSSLTLLSQLYLSNNRLSLISSGLITNIHLSILDISHNNLIVIENIYHMSNLEKLSLQNNQIKIVTQEMKQLVSLTELYLANNLIQTVQAVPATLKTIDLQNNQIHNFDWVIRVVQRVQQDQIQHVNLRNNPISQPTLILLNNVFSLLGTKILI